MRKAANRIPISNSVGGAIFPACSTACVLGRLVLYVGEEVFSPETGNSPEGGGGGGPPRSVKKAISKWSGREGEGESNVREAEQTHFRKVHHPSSSSSARAFSGVSSSFSSILFAPFVTGSRDGDGGGDLPVLPLSSFGTRGQKRRQNERNIRFV